MATPGPTFWQQIEADERRRHATDRANARAFIAKRFEPILKKAGVKFVIDVTRGDTNNWSVGEIVCNHAKMLKATAVVMAPHGKGRMKEFFVGSVCNHCLHRCEAPLVMVRPERVDADGVKKKTSDDAAVISTAEGATQTVNGAVGGKVTNGDGREAVGVSA